MRILILRILHYGFDLSFIDFFLNWPNVFARFSSNGTTVNHRIPSTPNPIDIIPSNQNLISKNRISVPKCKHSKIRPRLIKPIEIMISFFMIKKLMIS